MYYQLSISHMFRLKLIYDFKFIFENDMIITQTCKYCNFFENPLRTKIQKTKDAY